MVQCPYCPAKLNRADQEGYKSILRVHIETFHPEKVIG